MRTTIPDSVVTFFSSFRAPEHREIAIFRFRPGPGISGANGRPTPKWPKILLFLCFPARGGLVGQNVNCKKSADNHPGQRGNLFFLRFGTPSTGKLRFSVFGPGPEFL